MAHKDWVCLCSPWPLCPGNSALETPLSGTSHQTPSITDSIPWDLPFSPSPEWPFIHFCVLPQHALSWLLEFFCPLAAGLVGGFGPSLNTDSPSCDDQLKLCLPFSLSLFHKCPLWPSLKLWTWSPYSLFVSRRTWWEGVCHSTQFCLLKFSFIFCSENNQNIFLLWASTDSLAIIFLGVGGLCLRGLVLSSKCLCHFLWFQSWARVVMALVILLWI